MEYCLEGGRCPNLKDFPLRIAGIQLGRSGRAGLRASAPEAAGAKTPDSTDPFAVTEAPVS